MAKRAGGEREMKSPLTVSEATKLFPPQLRMTKNKLYSLMRRKKITYYLVNGRKVFFESDIARFLEWTDKNGWLKPVKFPAEWEKGEEK